MEDFIAEVTYLEYLKKEKCMNDNHVFHNHELQEEKELNFIVHTVGYPMYIRGFRARQHLRSLAPVMNDYR